MRLLDNATEFSFISQLGLSRSSHLCIAFSLVCWVLVPPLPYVLFAATVLYYKRVSLRAGSLYRTSTVSIVTAVCIGKLLVKFGYRPSVHSVDKGLGGSKVKALLDS